VLHFWAKTAFWKRIGFALKLFCSLILQRCFSLKVSELKPRSAVAEITLEIVSKGEVREFANERGSGKVCSTAAKDEAGEEVTLSLWNEQIDQFKEGQKVKIENGWCSEFQGQKQVSTGKFGKMEIVE